MTGYDRTLHRLFETSLAYAQPYCACALVATQLNQEIPMARRSPGETGVEVLESGKVTATPPRN